MDDDSSLLTMHKLFVARLVYVSQLSLASSSDRVFVSLCMRCFWTVLSNLTKFWPRGDQGSSPADFLKLSTKTRLQKPPRKPQGYQRYRTSGRGTTANQMKKEKTTSISKHAHDYNTTGIAQVSIRNRFRPCSKDPKLCSFDKEHSLGVMPMNDVGLQVLFSVAALLNLVFSLFFRLMSPLSNDKTGRGCSPLQFLWCCDHGHACWSTLFFPFSLKPDSRKT